MNEKIRPQMELRDEDAQEENHGGLAAREIPMTDHRIELAIMFAERLVDLQDMPALKAVKVAAAAHDIDAEALLIAWLRQLLLHAGALVLDPGAEAPHSDSRAAG